MDAILCATDDHFIRPSSSSLSAAELGARRRRPLPSSPPPRGSGRPAGVQHAARGPGQRVVQRGGRAAGTDPGAAGGHRAAADQPGDLCPCGHQAPEGGLPPLPPPLSSRARRVCRVAVFLRPFLFPNVSLSFPGKGLGGHSSKPLPSKLFPTVFSSKYLYIIGDGVRLLFKEVRTHWGGRGFGWVVL